MIFNKAQDSVEENIKTLMAKRKKEHEQRLAQAISNEANSKSVREAATG